MHTTTESIIDSQQHRKAAGNEPLEEWNRSVESIYREHFGPLCSAARRFVDTTHAAEEVVQESFARFSTLRNRPQLGSEVAYLRSIVMNEARSTLRRRQVANRHCHRIATRSSTDDDTSMSVINSVGAETIRRQVDDLPQRQRQVVTLRHLVGLSERETADALAISTGSVKTHASRGLATIRKSLDGAT